MFLVQLGALAAWKAEFAVLPRLTEPWTDALRGLTPGFAGDAPWKLVAPEGDLPGFLQAPDPGGLQWKEVVTPDELDVLNTARNHDVKRGINREPSLEDWVLALVSLQTMAGYAGSGQYGIARMNGGHGSRCLVGLAPGSAGDVTLNASLWWGRDVRRLLTERTGGLEASRGTVGGAALLWCLGWEEEDQVEVETLDPWFIEICRRVRLDCDEGRIIAWTSSSKATRIAVKGLKGDVGDPWAPIHKKERKSFTIGGGQFDHARLCEFLYSGEWELPVLARHGRDEVGKDMVLVAEALSRGKGRTDGFKSRVMPVPDGGAGSESATAAAREQLEEARVFQQALGYALAVAAARGDWNAVEDNHFARSVPAVNRLNQTLDRVFFEYLWRRLEDEDGRIEFLEFLWEAVLTELEVGLLELSRGGNGKEKGHARARRVLRNRIWRKYPALFEQLRATPTVSNEGRAALSVAGMLPHLGQRELGELRRMRVGWAPPAFGRLASRHPQTIGLKAQEEEWMAVVRVLAILTPAGGRELHDGRRQLGEVLCDGGDLRWPGGAAVPRPAFNERWLAQFMRARGSVRAGLLERAMRVSWRGQ